MLRGRFGESSGRPYVSARVFIPRLALAGNVSFIFDTGADSSVLMPADAATLAVDYGMLATPSRRSESEERPRPMWNRRALRLPIRTKA